MDLQTDRGRHKRPRTVSTNSGGQAGFAARIFRNAATGHAEAGGDWTHETTRRAIHARTAWRRAFPHGALSLTLSRRDTRSRFRVLRDDQRGEAILWGGWTTPGLD